MRARLRKETSPESACCSAPRMARSVDLPAPLGPIRPMRSPSWTAKVMFSKRGVAPKRLEMFCAIRIGGISLVAGRSTTQHLGAGAPFMPGLIAYGWVRPRNEYQIADIVRDFIRGRKTKDFLLVRSESIPQSRKNLARQPWQTNLTGTRHQEFGGSLACSFLRSRRNETA